MFNGKLFNFKVVEKETGRFVFEVVFDPEHEVFKGHFPGRPVVPGVLLMQTVKECFESVSEHSGLNIIAGDLKFTNPVIPEKGTSIIIEILYSEVEGTLKIRSNGYRYETKYFKINFELKNS
ncbi:MAG TPA: hypothetical protein PKG52_12140 [bacterium]|nr:hypothetical protein [bacterium]HPS30556.1 hypothetical protein [bacterium]